MPHGGRAYSSRAGKAQVTDPRRLRLHPHAGRVPEMPAPEFDAFLADIARRGILVPVEVTAAGVLLDGRQRLRAALQLQLDRIPVRCVSSDDDVDYMLRAALLRRDLSPSQRAALAIELEEQRRLRTAGKARRLANLRQNRSEVATLPPRGKTRELAAAFAGVSPRTVQDAATVLKHDDALFERVKAGSVTASIAARKVRRRLRDAAVPAAPPLPDGPVDLLYVDPPWKMGSPDSEHAPEQHYPTMPLAEIKQLQVPAAEDAVLFLWAVNSMLPAALEVIEAWGFAYKSCLVWVKPSIKLGNYFRNQHELLLFARKGNYPVPDQEDRVSSVIDAPAGRHSAKPQAVYALIERCYPHASKLELFARGKPRPGWAAWGNEVTR